MRGPALPILIAALVPFSAAADCTLTCDVGTTCYATSQEAMDCLESIPFNAEWATATIDVLSQSLENFGFAALYHNTGPPYNIKLDVQGELANTQAMINGEEFETDLDFQEHVQEILTTTLDAHTRYSKPACYNAIFLQPFAFDMRIESEPSSASTEPVVYLMNNLYTDAYSNIYPDVNVETVIGKRVVLLNGLEFTTEISNWGETHETRSNNPGIRFNAALRSYLYRSAISYNIDGLTDLTITLEDGSEHTFPWLASYTNGLADTSVCAAKEVTAKESSPKRRFATPFMHDQSDPEFIESPRPLTQKVLEDTRTDRQTIVPPTTPYPVSCFVQTILGDSADKAGVSKVLVMRVSSFSGDGFYLDFWQGFLNNAQQCLSVDFDMVVVDVMQNGGGYVCLGLRLIELLVEDYDNDHTKVQMNYDLPHSSLMDEYIKVVNAPNPYPDPQAVEQIIDRSTQQAFPDGHAYYYPGRNVTQGGKIVWRSNFFSLNCTQAEAMPEIGWRPPRYMPPEKLILLTDGTCGSTCASFTKIPQEDGKATLVGVGGIWNEGMDVSSFAGGFVCNPSYLQDIATWSGTTFPKFLTNQRWQFNWALWYSAKTPSRPIQFTVQDPNYREAFWGFPHVSIDADVTTSMVSSLYDRVIASTVDRLAAAAPEDSDDDDDHTGLIITIIALAIALALSLAALFYVYFFNSKMRKYSFVARDDPSNPLQRDLVSDA